MIKKKFLIFLLCVLFILSGCSSEYETKLESDLNNSTIDLEAPINVVYKNVKEGINKSGFMISPPHTRIIVKYLEGNFDSIKIYLYDSEYQNEYIQLCEIDEIGDDVTFSNLTQEKLYFIGFEFLEGYVGGGEQVTLQLSD